VGSADRTKGGRPCGSDHARPAFFELGPAGRACAAQPGHLGLAGRAAPTATAAAARRRCLGLPRGSARRAALGSCAVMGGATRAASRAPGQCAAGCDLGFGACRAASRSPGQRAPAWKLGFGARRAASRSPGQRAPAWKLGFGARRAAGSCSTGPQPGVGYATAAPAALAPGCRTTSRMGGTGRCLGCATACPACRAGSASARGRSGFASRVGRSRRPGPGLGAPAA